MTNKSCFVIAPIGEAESETRKRSDQVLKHVIFPATAACGYKAVRADQISEPGMITSQVIQHIVEDPLVIADLTDRNPNVFYELAIRHAIRKPLVQLIKKGEQIPFDVAGTRTIHVDHRDLDSVEDAKKEIISQIQALEKDSSKLETPISVSLDLQMLRQSDNPEQRVDLAERKQELLLHDVPNRRTRERDRQRIPAPHSSPRGRDHDQEQHHVDETGRDAALSGNVDLAVVGPVGDHFGAVPPHVRGRHDLGEHDPVALRTDAQHRMILDDTRAHGPVVEATARRSGPEIERLDHTPTEGRHREQHHDRRRDQRQLAPPSSDHIGMPRSEETEPDRGAQPRAARL